MLLFLILCFVCVCMCVSPFFNLIIFPVYFLKREREKGVELGRWEGARDMGGVGREENLIRMYCITFFFNKMYDKGVIFSDMQQKVLYKTTVWS